MSEGDTNKKFSNEEIIKELTKDVEDQTIAEDRTPSQDENLKDMLDTSKAFLINPVTNYSDIENELCVESDTSQNIPADDFIDEEALKDVEATLSATEKEERKVKAAELKKQGNDEFKEAKYLESIQTYSEALRLCPLDNATERSILYSNRAASKIQLKRKDTAIEDCSKAIELNSNYVRAYLRRARLYEETEKLDECLADYNKVAELNPGNSDAISASVRLPPLINERNEKMKEEMLGKLKDFGNLLLRPFGLSTDNFKMNQDPNTGGYSVNFQQNANKH